VSRFLCLGKGFFREANMTDNNIQDETFTGTYFIEAINQILVEVNCPSTARKFIDTLIGYAEEKIKFDASDLELGLRADNLNNNRSNESAQKWVQRNRKKLQEWQKQNNVFLVEFKPGFRSGDKPNYVWVSSSYHLHIIEYAKQVLADAREDETIWKRLPKRAIEKAARNKVRNIVKTPIVFKPRTPKDKDLSQQISTKLRSALTKIERARELCEENNLILEGDNVDRVMEVKLAIEDLECHIPEE
jgi:hypothetical protein